MVSGNVVLILVLFLNFGIGVADGYELYIIGVLFYGGKVVFGYAATPCYGDTNFTVGYYGIHGEIVLSAEVKVLSLFSAET